MFWLSIVSLIWAFSFGLIKTHLAGMDPTATATLRLAFALLVFLPFLRPGKIKCQHGLALAAIGAVQFGLMYAFYMTSFRLLHAHEVAFFTIFTPLYVTLLNAGLERKFHARWLVAAILAVIGTGAVVWQGIASADFLAGFALVQLSNICFALGQVAYKRLRPRLTALRDDQIFGWLIFGGLLATTAYSFIATDWSAFHPTSRQWLILFYLGTIASGLGFFMWNRGIVQVNTGTLAVLNNLKIPLAMICSFLFFDDTGNTNFPMLALSLALLTGAVWLTEHGAKSKS